MKILHQIRVVGKKKGFSKKTGCLIFYYLKCEADIAVLQILAKLELT